MVCKLPCFYLIDFFVKIKKIFTAILFCCRMSGEKIRKMIKAEISQKLEIDLMNEGEYIHIHI